MNVIDPVARGMAAKALARSPRPSSMIGLNGGYPIFYVNPVTGNDAAAEQSPLTNTFKTLDAALRVAGKIRNDNTQQYLTIFLSPGNHTMNLSAIRFNSDLAFLDITGNNGDYGNGTASVVTVTGQQRATAALQQTLANCKVICTQDTNEENIFYLQIGILYIDSCEFEIAGKPYVTFGSQGHSCMILGTNKITTAGGRYMFEINERGSLEIIGTQTLLGAADFLVVGKIGRDGVVIAHSPIVGTATGTRHTLASFARVKTNGTGANYFPGSIAGTVEPTATLV